MRIARVCQIEKSYKLLPDRAIKLSSEVMAFCIQPWGHCMVRRSWRGPLVAANILQPNPFQTDPVRATNGNERDANSMLCPRIGQVSVFEPRPQTAAAHRSSHTFTSKPCVKICCMCRGQRSLTCIARLSGKATEVGLQLDFKVVV